MAKKTSFNFGANKKPRKPKAARKTNGGGRGNKSNAWRAYVSAPAHSSAPLPD